MSLAESKQTLRRRARGSGRVYMPLHDLIGMLEEAASEGYESGHAEARGMLPELHYPGTQKNTVRGEDYGFDQLGRPVYW